MSKLRNFSDVLTDLNSPGLLKNIIILSLIDRAYFNFNLIKLDWYFLGGCTIDQY